MKGFEQLQQQLCKVQNGPVTREQAVEAFHNLSGFMSLLIRINEREQIIPTKQKGPDHENQ